VAPISLTHELQALILRVTVKILVDIDVLRENIELGELIDSLLGESVGIIEGLLSLRVDLPITPYGRRMALKRKLDSYVYNLIDQRLVVGHDAGDILSILLQAMNTQEDVMTKQHVRDELMALAAAGHETTTNTMAWTFYLLSEHPAILQRVLAELETVLGRREARVDDLPQLTYLDQVVKESMRLYPSAWTQGRQAVEAFDLDGYHLPAGTMMMFSQWVLHRLPDVWGDPEVFRPERWDPDTGQKVPQWAYFPFGAGSRICMGMPLAQLQIRLVLATILQRYIPRLLVGHLVAPLPLITLRLKQGLRVRLEPTPGPAFPPAPVDAQVKA
jgi:cytochrome P450